MEWPQQERNPLEAADSRFSFTTQRAPKSTNRSGKIKEGVSGRSGSLYWAPLGALTTWYSMLGLVTSIDT